MESLQMEDLEVNPFYRMLLTKFRAQFETACKKSFLIAIPHSDTLENLEPDQAFVNAHLLVPSKLLRMHYTPLQVGHFEDIEFDGKKLICLIAKKQDDEKQVVVVNVLAQEIGYNINAGEYRTLLVDRPLVVFMNRPFMRSILAPLSPARSSMSPEMRAKRRRLNNSKILNHQDECIKYLDFISTQLTKDLELVIINFEEKFLNPFRLDDRFRTIDYLKNIVLQLHDTIEIYSPKYIDAINQIGINTEIEVYKRSVRLCVENYCVFYLHDSLMNMVQTLFKDQDVALLGKLNIIRKSRFTVCQLGAQDVFSDFALHEELIKHIEKLPDFKSPVALVNSLVKLTDLITESLSQSVRFKRLVDDSQTPNAIFEPHSEHQVSICSDDLIASFVFALAQVRPKYLYSMMKYLELFGWSSIDRDQAAYCAATFQVVIQYTCAFDKEIQERGSSETTA